ncbi:Fic family protein [bacterium]|nr:MAG: Fic family protein [bacterium]
MRSYETTHPWITFQFDLRKISYKLWLKLGEVQSKSEHLAGVPLRPSTARRLHQVYLAKGAAATTAIEGNTLSEKEVLDFLDGKLKVSPTKEYLVQEVENIINACNLIAKNAFEETSPVISVEEIKQYNRFVLDKLKLEDNITPGGIRTYSVGVARYKAAPFEDCEYLLTQLCNWINKDFPSSGETKTAFGVLKAVITHLYFAWIHPFGDGNGRTARLLEFRILLEAGIPPAAAHLLSNHYNQTRQEYYRQLENASKSGGDITPFIEYAVNGFVEGLREQISVIRDQQWSVTWRNYVHETFKDKNSNADIRRRHLVLDLSAHKDFVPISKVKELSPRVAVNYSGKSDMTLSRDINELVQMNLIERSTKGIRAKQEIILAFLPPAKIN